MEERGANATAKMHRSAGRLPIGDVSCVRMRIRFCHALARCQVGGLEFTALVVCLVDPLIEDAAKSFEGFLMLRQFGKVPDFVRIILEIVKLFLRHRWSAQSGLLWRQLADGVQFLEEIPNG